ncbi:MAG: TonB-dependent receptor [Tannerella sp.]|jgi:TonB-linked SusC/RagA family outer membrane protein|nr:TonB-dependent receptor [Tannerella sp.]
MRAKIVLLIVFCGFIFQLHAQNRDSGFTVTGSVKDESGMEVPGATVQIKGKSQGVATDIDGHYSISNIVANDILIFSYLGYQSQEIAVGNKRTIDVILVESTSILDEVVVVAYGTQKKESVVAAISSIKATGLRQTPASNIGIALAGRLPGLTVLQRSGAPGAENMDFYIRGRSTTNEQRPLLMVDGVEREFSALDPHEIETISILKDASATAVYGVRGANGVIMVTTRRGEVGKPIIDVTMEHSWQSPTRLPDMVSAYDYAQLRNQVNRQNNLPLEYSDYELDRYRLGDMRELYPVRNFVEEFTKNNFPMNRINANISGGSDKMRYFTTVGYMYQEGLFKTERFDEYDYDPSTKANRINFRSNFDIDINSSLKMWLNISGYMQKKNDPVLVPNNPSYYDDANAYGVLLANLLTTPNLLFNDLTPDGEVMSNRIRGGNATNAPYGMLNRTGFKNTMTSQVNTTLGLEQKLDFITKGLSIRAVASYDATSLNQQMRSRTFQVYEAIFNEGDPASLHYEILGSSTNSPLTDKQIQNFHNLFNIDASVNYSNKFGLHDVTGMFLFNRYQKVINIALPYNYIGLVGRATYGYNNRYLAELNFGYNGSEQFAPGKQFGFFPSFSLGWVLSEEDFMKQSLSWLSFMKLRASYGKVGNDRMGASRFLYIDNWSIGGSGWSGLPSGTVENSIANKNISWEINNKYNVGLEARFPIGLSMDLDLFYEVRDNILIRDAGTIPTGIFGSGAVGGNGTVQLPPINSGEIENRGFEIMFGYNKYFGQDWHVGVNVNAAYNRNKVIYMNEVLLPEDYAERQRMTGFRLGQRFGYKTDGFFNTQEEIDSWYDQTPLGAAPKLGDLKYLDQNGDNRIDEKDMVPIGDPDVPEWNFGGSVNVQYKLFDLSLMFQGAAKRSIHLNGIGIWETDNFNEWHKEAWTAEKYANGEKITYPRLDPGSNASKQMSDFWLVSGDYIRLKNAEIGFSLPSNITKKMGLTRLRIYANGLNLLTFDKTPVKYFDPEQNNNLIYPLFKAYNIGLNVSF